MLTHQCGNGVTEDDEECDDGNDEDEDDCTNLCEFPDKCGNGLRDYNEGCDDGMRDRQGCAKDCSGPALGWLCWGGSETTHDVCVHTCNNVD